MIDTILSLWPLSLILGGILAIVAAYLRGHYHGFKQGRRYAMDKLTANIDAVLSTTPIVDELIYQGYGGPECPCAMCKARRAAKVDQDAELDRELGK